MVYLLRSEGLTVEEITKPKQTATTQRWKPSITSTDRRLPVHTKIEFSHRSSDRRRTLEAVQDGIVAPYALRAPTVLHYTAPAAIERKISALAYCSATQARDVFDLDLLLRRHRDAIGIGEIDSPVLDLAVDRVFERPFEAFRDQVLRFLDRETIELYGERATWEQIQTFVAERLLEPR